MRLIRGGGQPHSDRVRLGQRHHIPQWLREWLENNRGKFVLLACGHRDDLNSKGITIIVGNETAVLCAQCDEWTEVIRPITLMEYAKIEKPPESDTPMF